MMDSRVQELRIAGMNCRLYLPPGYEEEGAYYPVIYVNGDIPVADVMTELANIGAQTDFLLLSIQPQNWNDDFTPWTAPAFRAGEEAPQGRADAYLTCLTEKIKPYIHMHYRTQPEPA
ncbi:MAG: alpha/beta hydrolase, partial [Lachnospiraceae bacterium]|nr:alpha/beta hydrolase [Lachnospiraceae bacterium]